MVKLKRLFLAVTTVFISLALSGCHLVVFQPSGHVARDERDLLITAISLMAIIVIPVILLVFIIAFKYRASNKKAKYTPDWAHNNALEAAWWVLPILIIIALGIITWISTHALDPYKPLDKKALGLTNKTVHVQAVALRWKWLFIYPDQGIATVNYLEFPANTQVSFEITSDAPMNSFQIPALAGQIYSMNGMRTKLHLVADKTGVFHGRSVSFSGYGFANMRFSVHSVTESQFQAWVKHVKTSAKNKLTLDAYNKLVLPSENDPASFYSSVHPNLFQTIIHRFLTPNRHKVNTNELGVHL